MNVSPGPAVTSKDARGQQRNKIMTNQTISAITLLGFPNLSSINVLMFFFLLTSYCFSIFINLAIIGLVIKNESLHSPMYFLLTQLSLTDILWATNIIPNMLSTLFSNGVKMSLTACLTQFFFFGASESAECLFLMVMSYDRYMAICNPLHYTSKMTNALCLKLVILSWVLSFFILLHETISISQLDFCGPNVIDHFFCDYAPLLQLSCSDTFYIRILTYIMGSPLIFFPFILIVISYAYIAFIILRIPTSSGRQKTFSTCSSHLAVVCMYYGTLMAIYVVPSEGRSLTLNKVLSMAYTILNPLLNPIIYSLRNNDIKRALRKLGK
ncbi:olfactory receptor 11L1-like [Pyxicephalus adspersus]|uniref:olfactory receptor 11L1-like n=1 Tax=Pyxicephalus adspersus TaxID=30357 RepID=UPI003B5CE79D